MRSLLFAILFTLSAGLFGATQLRTRVSSNTLQERELFYYTLEIVVTDSTGKSRPDIQLPEMPAGLPFKVSAPQGPMISSSTSVRVINGRRTTEVLHTYSYNYPMMPTRTGTLQLPAMEVKINGTTYQTQPITFTVSKPGESSGGDTAGITVRQECDAASAVPGMPVHLRYAFAFPPQKVSSENIVIHGPIEELQQLFRLPPDFDFRQGWSVDREYRNGMPMQCYTLDVELVPLKAGVLTLPPFSLTFSVYDDEGQQKKRRRSESLFESFFDDDPFFSRRATRQVTIASNELTLHVGELPSEGRPENYSGILGAISASASLDQQQVSVGDPVILEITLKGIGVCADMKLPGLQENPAVTALFNVSANEDPGQYDAENRSIVFQRTIRPRTDGDIAFPALAIPYYDPADQRYHTADTAPIPLSVKAVKQVTLQDATITGTAAAAPSAHDASKEKLERSADGLSADFSAKEVLDDASSSNGAAIREQLFLFAALPALAWLLCLIGKGLILLRNASPEKRAANAAASQLKRAAKAYAPGNADATADLYHALQLYAVRRFNLGNRTAVAIADLEALHLAPAVLDAWRKLLEAADAARYAGSTIPADELHKLLKAAMKYLNP